MSNYVYDTFTGSNDTRLDQHDGETNADWQIINAANYNKITNNRVHRSLENPTSGEPCANGSEHFLSNYSLPKASYVIEAYFYNIAYYDQYSSGSSSQINHPCGITTDANKKRTNSFAGLIARYTNTNNFYYLKYDQLNALWSIVRYNNSVLDSISPGNNTYFDIIDAGENRKVQFVLRGRFVELYLDDVLCLSLFDNDVDALIDAGWVGLRFDTTDDYIIHPPTEPPQEFTAENTHGMHIDNFRVSDEIPVEDLVEDIELTGQGYTNGEVDLEWTA